MLSCYYLTLLRRSINDKHPTFYRQCYVEPNIWIEKKILLKIPEPILAVTYKVGIIAENILINLAIVAVIVIGYRRAKPHLCDEINQNQINLCDSIFQSIVNFTDPFDYLQDLNRSFQRGRLSNTFPSPEIENELGMLISYNCNTMLIGDPGSGKSTTILSFVKLLESPKCPPSLRGKRIYQLNLDTLLGDPKSYLKRISIMLRVLSDPNAILFIDEAHRLNEEIHGHRLSDSLKILLESKYLTIIGTTTKHECQKWFKQDAAMQRRFYTIEMPSATKQDHIHKLKAKFQADQLSDEVLDKSIELAKLYLPSESLPASAIKVIELVQADKKYRRDSSPINLFDFNSKILRMLKLG